LEKVLLPKPENMTFEWDICQIRSHSKLFSLDGYAVFIANSFGMIVI